ncbi:hypothetical protein OPQ81_003915 [Rhizoctonia solani]|nr:hypothetical protein OPQ81_003915 [Rhizoctonia solani]
MKLVFGLQLCKREDNPSLAVNFYPFFALGPELISDVYQIGRFNGFWAARAKSGMTEVVIKHDVSVSAGISGSLGSENDSSNMLASELLLGKV